MGHAAKLMQVVASRILLRNFFSTNYYLGIQLRNQPIGIYRLLESLPKMNRLPQSETTSILVRQLNCMLYLTKSKWPWKPAFSQMCESLTKGVQKCVIHTLHRQNTTAIGCCGQHVPNRPAIDKLFALHPVVQIVQDACTCGSHNNRLVTAWFWKINHSHTKQH